MLCWITCDSCIIAAREDAYGRVQKTNQETESVLQSNITTHSCLPQQLTLITDNSKHIPNSYSTLAQLLPFCTPLIDKDILIWRNPPTSTITFSSSIVALCIRLLSHCCKILYYYKQFYSRWLDSANLSRYANTSTKKLLFWRSQQ